MPSQAENAVIQAVETIGGTASILAIVLVGGKLWNDRAPDPTSKLLIQSLCFFNLVLSVFFAVGRGAKGSDGFCQFQGLMIQWFSTALMLWVVLQSYVMYQWVVLKKHFKRMERMVRRSIIAIIIVSGALAFLLLGTGAYSSVYLWCWIAEDEGLARIFAFDIILLASWASSLYVLREVTHSIAERVKASSLHESISIMLGNSSYSVENKLTLYIGSFIFIWFFALLNRSVETGLNRPFFPTALLQAIFLSFQGMVNALLYGNVIDLKKLFRVEDFRKVFLGIQAPHHSQLTESVVEHRPISMGKSASLVPQPPILYTPKQYSIFITTLNMGEAPLDSFYGDVKDWIVEGHDVYAIGLQECIELAGLRELILNHLGGPSKYTMFTTSIGSGNTSLGYHGFIALTLFVKTAAIQAGHIYPTKPAAEAAATGTDLIITTAQNKGAVGLALHIHDTCIGFVTCHLPSDSKGKSKLTKRNASAHAILKQVILAPEDLGFDLHLQHDHVFVFGDLNYRMETTGTGGGVNSLTGVAVACTIEKQRLNDDPNWLARKYNLLRHHTDVLYPSLEEVKLIKAALSGSRGAWSSVLRADELRSIMDDGDAFFGFEEPMPCFPPSYKRRKGKAEGSCGDYTDFAGITRGYSNTGEVENMLVVSKSSSSATTGLAGSLERVQNFMASSRPSSSRLTANEIRNLEVQLKKTGSGNDLTSGSGSSKAGGSGGSHGRLRSSSSGGGRGSRESDEKEEDGLVPEAGSSANDRALARSGEIAPSPSDDSSDLPPPPQEGEVPEECESPSSRSSSHSHSKRRKAAVLATGGVESLPSRKEIDPSKLRPPSYTDRILLHSLPDRQEKVTVQAYDFCDTVRCSDHRAVSMTVLVEVNSSVTFGAPKPAEMDYNPLSDRQSVVSTAAATTHEPAFELYEVVITDLHVTLFDLQDVEEEEEEDDEDVVYRDSGYDITTLSENPMRRNTAGGGEGIFSSRPTSSSSSSKALPSSSLSSSEAGPSGEASSSIVGLSLATSPGRSALRQGKKGSMGGSVRFGDGQSTDGESMIEMSTTTSSNKPSWMGENTERDGGREEAVQLPEVMVPDTLNSHEEPRKGASGGGESKTEVVVAPSSSTVSSPSRPTLAKGKSSRRRSLFSVFFSSSSAEPDHEDVEAGKTANQKNVEEERRREQELIKELSRENMDWKNKLHKPNEWRKKKLEEQRRLKAEQNATLQQLSKQVQRKNRKSDDKNIHQVTIVFPLPSKDPLLVHRKVFDYAQVFEMHNQAVVSQAETVVTQSPVEGDAQEGAKISKEELLRPFSTFPWSTTSLSTTVNNFDKMGPTVNPLLASGPTTRSSMGGLSSRTQTVIGSSSAYKVKGCASVELGAHVLIKLSNKAGYEFGSSVVCLSQLLHADKHTLYSSYIKEIPLAAGGQKRGHLSGKFSMRYIPSPLSTHK